MFHELAFPKGKDEIGDYGVTNPAEAVNSSPGGATRQFPASGPDGSKQPAQTIRSQSRSAAAATLTVYAFYDNLSIIMQIGQRLRLLREQESLSQGDVEERTGLLRCYISRVENGHTIPSLETLERLASALEMPLYELFCEGEYTPSRSARGAKGTAEQARHAETDGQRRFLEKVRHLIGRIDQKDRKILLYMAEKLAKG